MISLLIGPQLELRPETSVKSSEANDTSGIERPVCQSGIRPNSSRVVPWAAMKNNLTTLLFAVIVTLSIACTNDEMPEIATPVQPTSTPIQLPAASTIDQERNNLVNEAIRLATAGCPGIGERLSGPPTRVLAALTNSGATGGLTTGELLNPGSASIPGPGEGGGVTVWVVLIEGSSIPVIGEDPWGGANVRSFAFVLNAFQPKFTGCVVRDAPMPIIYQRPSCPMCGRLKFEVLLDRQ